MGESSNNGNLNSYDYQTSIGKRQLPGAGGLYRFGQTNGTIAADFDQNYRAINSFSQSGAGQYEVQGGETLQGIAASLWGDSALLQIFSHRH